MSTEPKEPSESATKAETRIMQLAGFPCIENFSVAVEIQHSINQACAERDAEIEKLMNEVSTNDIEFTKVTLEFLAKDEEIARLTEEMRLRPSSGEVIKLAYKHEKLKTHHAALRALLERVPHDKTYLDQRGGPDVCTDNCLRCAYEKLKP